MKQHARKIKKEVIVWIRQICQALIWSSSLNFSRILEKAKIY